MNSSHRGLPPLSSGLPGSLSLPPPERGHSTAPPPLGHLPAPPSQWAGQDDSMRSWLHAKAEEDRRKQEEEKTRQESLRLDQRRIEQDMLRDSLQGGVPPPMVPLIFAGIGGGNLPAHTLEWAQQYLASLTIQNQQQQQQLQAQQQQLHQQQIQAQQQQMSPEIHRDTRITSSHPYSAHQPLPPPAPAPPAAPAQASQGRGSISDPTSAANALSRLNTTEFIPSSATTHTPRQPLHPSQQAQTASSDQSSGPGLFFHHWTPPNPNSVAAANQPPTPSGKSTQGSPFSQAAVSHLRSDYQNSPKKRKTAGGNPISIPPTSQPFDPSQPMSSRSSRERDMSPGHRHRPVGHSRQNSDASSREQDVGGRNIARPSSRQQRNELSGGAGPPPNRQLTGSSTSGSSEDVRYEGSHSETR